MKLTKIQVSYFSKRYRSLIDAEEKNFDSCSCCLRFKDDLDAEECPGCENEDARRINGHWTLTKIIKLEKRTRLYFKQGDQSLCYVMFNTEDGADRFVEKSDYELLGWQKSSSRHNTITFV
jgi:hypothetical protein